MQRPLTHLCNQTGSCWLHAKGQIAWCTLHSVSRHSLLLCMEWSLLEIGYGIHRLGETPLDHCQTQVCWLPHLPSYHSQWCLQGVKTWRDCAYELLSHKFLNHIARLFGSVMTSALIAHSTQHLSKVSRMSVRFGTMHAAWAKVRVEQSCASLRAWRSPVQNIP